MPVYLDHAATTPMRAEARQAWLQAAETVGNPSSIHGDGQSARRLLEESRERLAVTLGCDAIEVVFTSGGTESVNLALKGLWWSRQPGRAAFVLPDGEHHATLDTAAWLAAHEGADVRAVSARCPGPHSRGWLRGRARRRSGGDRSRGEQRGGHGERRGRAGCGIRCG